MGPTEMIEQLKLSSNEEVVAQLKADVKFMDGVRRGIADCRSGRVRRWDDVKAELHIE